MEETFASLLLLRWDVATNEITYANAGHCRPALVGTGAPEIVAYSDIILGLDAEAEFKDTTIELQPGQALVAYTDGLMEQRLSTGQMMGEDGVMEVASAAYGQPAPVDAMLASVLSRSDPPEFIDDILVFWLQKEA
jgi:serine phosphatase RsbU (regulator of sigma subunit)